MIPVQFALEFLPEAFCAQMSCCDGREIDRGLKIQNQSGVERNFAILRAICGDPSACSWRGQAGADRQVMHEVIREHALAAWAEVSAGRANPLIEALCADQRIAQFLEAAAFDRC